MSNDIVSDIISERIKQLRKTLHLTQKDFGERIGLKPNSISDIENGKNSITDIVMKAICLEFDANENWLRNGNGEPFIQKSREEILGEYATEITLGDDEFIRGFIERYMKLSPENKKLFGSLFRD